MPIQRVKAKIRTQLGDKTFGAIFKGSLLTFGAKIIGVALGFVFNLIISHYYGAEALGVFALVSTFFVMALIPALFGTGISILRLIPEHIARHSLASARQLYSKVRLFIIATAGAVSLLMYGGSAIIAEGLFHKPSLAGLFAMATLFIIPRALTDLNINAIRALKSIRMFALFQILGPAANILILILLTCCFFDRYNPVYTLFYSALLLFALSTFLARRQWRRHDTDAPQHIETIRLTQLATLSFPMFLTSAMGAVMTQIDIVMIGIYQTTEAVGVYAVAMKFALLTSFVLSSVNAIAAPTFSELYAKNEMHSLQQVAQKSSRMIFYAIMPIIAGLVVFGQALLGAFGELFTAGYPAMLILLVGQLFNALAGSVGYLMNMTGYQKAYNSIMMTGAAVNIVLNILLIPTYGINGAAVASMISMVLWNLLALIFVRINLGFYAGYFPGLMKGAR